MKSKLFFIVSIPLIFFGCKEEKKIEIIPAENYYYQFSELDQPPNFISKDSTNKTKEFVDLSMMISEFYKSLPENEKGEFQLNYQFLFNESGELEKIQVVESKYPQIDKKIAELIKDWKFQPAEKKGKRVKFIYPWSINFNKESGDYYVMVDEMPEPIGGLYAIQSKIKYPEAAKNQGIEGKVYIQAFINESGNVDNAKVLKGIGGGCDEAALDAVMQTKFKPGIHNGKPVKVQVSIPIRFKLN